MAVLVLLLIVTSIGARKCLDQQRKAAELQGTAVHVIDDAARRPDHHVHSAPQGVQLRLVALAAVDREYMEALDVGGIPQKRLGDLQGKFAGGHQHQYLRLMLGQVDSRQRGQGKRRGFPRARLRLAQHVGSRQEHRDGGRLDGRRRLVAHVGERSQHGIR